MLRREQGRKGWLTPDYEAIMSWTGLSRSTVHRSLGILKAIGLVDWIRRFIYSRDDTNGARSEQTSNLYRFALPQWLAKLIGLHVPILTTRRCAAKPFWRIMRRCSPIRRAANGVG
jgi:hypothetical protein